MPNISTTRPKLRSVPSFAPWPHFAEDEVQATTKVLHSGKVNYWTGEEGRQFEREFADYIGTQYAVAVANGTSALELSLQALDIGPGDEVVVPSRTFIATASCVVMRGAEPVFADVDPVSQNVTAASIEAVLTPRTRAIIVVHLAGWPCDMETILALAKKHGLHVIEDCAQAHGAVYRSKHVGAFGDVAAFSFCQDKIMTTGGEGGMVVTDSEEIWEKAWSLKDHGKSYRAVYDEVQPAGFKWLHQSCGTNWRLTEMQAAIGRIQLRKLPDWLLKRRTNAAMLEECFQVIPALRTTLPPKHIRHAYYKYYTFVRPDRLARGWDRDRIMEAINHEGVPCSSGSCSEVYLEQAFREQQLGPSERLPVAKELGENSLMFLVHPTLTEADIEYTGSVVAHIMKGASA